MEAGRQAATFGLALVIGRVGTENVSPRFGYPIFLISPAQKALNTILASIEAIYCTIPTS